MLESHRYAPFLRAEGGVASYGTDGGNLAGYTVGIEGGVHVWQPDDIDVTLHATLAYDDFSTLSDAFGLEGSAGARMSHFNGYWTAGLGARLGVARHFGADATVLDPLLVLGFDLSVGVPIGPVTVLGMWAISLKNLDSELASLRQGFTLGASVKF